MTLYRCYASFLSVLFDGCQTPFIHREMWRKTRGQVVIFLICSGIAVQILNRYSAF
ncbi:hypothetical protein Pcar_3473 [Syntrophotalea carbinolica DSM 2380]|uniref:Uncharacterized protein n=1 Tax=Syntrophotalea carbinolica (strain DSM 2380 / NBRC 103641 / GraBd1) TaxID=338963 RepID=J9UA25_SYNC1|nr:hypothetical protein Pcar_3473 [Syntrophotalea carbinolica DSM 2380]